MGLKANFDGNLIAEVTSGDIIELQTASFQAAEGDLTVNYTHAAAPIFTQVEGGCLMALGNFSKTFTPDVGTEKRYSLHTIEVTAGDILVDFIPTVPVDNDGHEHTITVTGTGILVDFIHVDDIPP